MYSRLAGKRLQNLLFVQLIVMQISLGSASDRKWLKVRKKIKFIAWVEVTLRKSSAMTILSPILILPLENISADILILKEISTFLKSLRRSFNDKDMSGHASASLFEKTNRFGEHSISDFAASLLRDKSFHKYYPRGEFSGSF